jgi:hypothetical protein
MSKRRDATPSTIASWIARGDGQGEGEHYKPFLKVRDVPSKGRSSMVLGLKTNRTHHYLSDIEYKVHILSEYDHNVEDIREQFALLPWEETQEIAGSLGIRHPTYPYTRTPIVMTSDIVITLKNNQTHKNTIISVKPSKDIAPENPKARRCIEKLLIEKTYWDRRKITWKLITEQEINHTRFHNLNNFRAAVVARELDSLNVRMPAFLERFKINWKPDATLNQILDATAANIRLSTYECFMQFGRAIWERQLPVDIDSRVIRHNRPVLKIMQHEC